MKFFIVISPVPPVVFVIHIQSKQDPELLDTTL